MPPPLHFIQGLTTLGFGTEILYSFVIIICSLMIYYGTRELYDLSSYKGIKYFRQAFLFFALAYFFRSFIKLIASYFNAQGILSISPGLFNPIISRITLMFFIYFSAMAIFYLIYSVMWKKWNHKNKIYVFHIIAIVISVLIILSGNSLLYLGLNIILLILVIIVVYTSHKSKKKKHDLYVIYILLLFFWIINIVDILIPTFFQTFQLLIYFTSSGIFLLMLYKVLKKVGPN